MSTLANYIVTPLGLVQEQSLTPPSQPAAPSRRVYRRPGPPPSQRSRTREIRRKQLPMSAPAGGRATPEPPPLASDASATKSPNHAPPRPMRRHLLLTATVAAVVSVLAVAAAHGGWHYFFGNEDPFPSAINASSSGSEEDTMSPSASKDSPSGLDHADIPKHVARAELSAADLLIDRFYELKFDDTGHVISARMPLDDDRRRFGPSLEEIDALARLPKLRELDLRDTIASVAVPIANRNPAVEVLMLEQQSDAASLSKLRGVRELRLRGSSIDVERVAGPRLTVIDVD